MENSAHCDFVKLRNMLIRTHMQDLKDVTRETHYENYRAHCIQSMTRMVVKERNRKYVGHARTDKHAGELSRLHRNISSELVCSKLTRESGTDFPIPALSGATDETEKLIREKDEEVRNPECRAEAQQRRRHSPDPDAPHEPEGLCYDKGDEYL